MGDQQVKTLHKIPEFNDYLCDEDGNIFSTKFGKLRKLKPHLHKARGKKFYLRVKISKCLQLVHRLVASAKYGRQLSSDEYVNHINAITEDNRFENIEIVSHEENVRHAVANNLYCTGEAWYLARGLNFNDYLAREYTQVSGNGEVRNIQLTDKI